MSLLDSVSRSCSLPESSTGADSNTGTFKPLNCPVVETVPLWETPSQPENNFCTAAYVHPAVLQTYSRGRRGGLADSFWAVPHFLVSMGQQLPEEDRQEVSLEENTHGRQTLRGGDRRRSICLLQPSAHKTFMEPEPLRQSD